MKTKKIITNYFKYSFKMISKKELVKLTNVKKESISPYLYNLRRYGFIEIVKNKYYIRNMNFTRVSNCDCCSNYDLLVRVEEDNIIYLCFDCIK